MRIKFQLCDRSEAEEILRTASLENILGKNELQRFYSFTSLTAGMDWLCSRIAMKRLLDNLFGSRSCFPQDAHKIEIINDAEGKPFLKRSDMGGQDIHVSLSHEKGMGAACFSFNAPVGVDVVAIKYIRRAVCDYFLSVKEQIICNKYFGRDGPSLFWAAKEAYLKALGTGFAISPKSFSIEIVDDHSRKPGLRIGHHPLYYEKRENYFVALVSAPSSL
jgi:phosphopantetheinyl transferase